MAADRQRQIREATSFVQHSIDAAHTALAADDIELALQRLSEAQTRIDASDVTSPVIIEKVAALQNEATRYGKFLQLCEEGRQHQYETEPWIPAVGEALALYDVMENPAWLATLRQSALPEPHLARVSDQVYEMLLQKADDLVRWESHWPVTGRRQRLEEQCKQALVCLKKAVSFHAPSRGYYWLLANCAQIQHDPERERDLRKTALKTPPHSAAELFYINRDHLWGSVSHHEGYPDYPFEQNLKDHREMLRFDPSYFNGLHYMGLRLNGEGRYREALVAWYGCLALRPGDFFSLCFRSRTHWRLKQYDEALIGANTVIDKFPDVIDGWTLRGLSYAGLKQFDKATSDLAKAIEVEKSVGGFGLEHPLQALAWVLATAPDDQVRDGARAVGLATKACALTEHKNAVMIDTLGAAYAESGDFESAVKSSEKAIELATDEAQRAELKQHLESFRQQKPWREK
jgi:tetratricopeptide (TPR) repeat protein